MSDTPSTIVSLGKAIERMCEDLPLGALRAKIDEMFEGIADAVRNHGEKSHQARLAREQYKVADRVHKRRESMIE